LANLMFDAKPIMVGESVASQLPGRAVGPADAYRHILLAAELTRVFGAGIAWQVLREHETDPDLGADNGLDFWNNEIGIQIGMHVAAKGGTWLDVVVLAREALAASFDGTLYQEISTAWNPPHQADEGIRIGYERMYGLIDADGNSQRPFSPTFEDFAHGFNREYEFRTSPTETIFLDEGRWQ
jgi:hypothetical protein